MPHGWEHHPYSYGDVQQNRCTEIKINGRKNEEVDVNDEIKT
jgi:hypothetical protein